MAVSTSIVLPPGSPLHHHHHHRRRVSLYPSPYLQNEIRPQSLFSFSTTAIYPFKSSSTRSIREIRCNFSGIDNRTGEEEEDDEGRNGNDKSDSELERALRLDGTIPGTSNEFVEQVSSRAYDMRRHLQQSFDSSSYDVLESNPWREDSKAVYVLTRRENELCTMKTRSNRSEVERELGQLFSKSRKLRNQAKKSPATKFQMLVEDIRDGVLVFEDETEAAKYCDLLQGGGQGCEGVAEIEASSVFDICRKMKALAVLFRRGRTPPLPENLKLNLRARKRSLEDQEEEESI